MNSTAGLQVGGGDTLVATTATLANGTFTFGNLGPGTYYVREAVPTGFIQTGGGPNGVAGDTYYTVVRRAGTATLAITSTIFRRSPAGPAM